MEEEKELFRIGEISKLFQIGVDSIRYYEKVGLLHPVRSRESNYRLYTLDDIRTMNTIRELLEIGFSTEEILDFETDRNISHVLSMLEKEKDVIDEKILHLKNIRTNINSRLRSINESLGIDTSGEIRLLDLPDRKCLMITDENMPDNEINYRLAEFTSSSSQKVTTIGACDCYILDTSGYREEAFHTKGQNREGQGDRDSISIDPDHQKTDDFPTKAVFFYSDYLDYKSNFLLSKGQYLSLSYRGSFRQTKKYYPKMLEYCRNHALTPAGDLMEFCHIDRYETSDVSEYLTELELPVKCNQTS